MCFRQFNIHKHIKGNFLTLLLFDLVGVAKLGLDDIALLGEGGRGGLSRVEGRDHQENFLNSNNLFVLAGVHTS